MSKDESSYLICFKSFTSQSMSKFNFLEFFSAIKIAFLEISIPVTFKDGFNFFRPRAIHPLPVHKSKTLSPFIQDFDTQ